MRVATLTSHLTRSCFLVTVLAAGCPALLDSRDTVSGTPFVNIPSSGNSGGGSLAPVPDVPDYGCDAPTDSESLAAEVLRLVNSERSSRGLTTLAIDDTLRLQAAKYACEMINDDFFAHVNPVTGSTLEDRAKEFGYEYSIIGENLAAGQTSAIQVVQDWMNSEGHRANILRPEFTEIGIAVRLGGDFGIYWVQEFGRPSAEVGPQP